MSASYKTAGRTRLLAHLAAHPDRHATADELAAELAASAAPTDKPIGKSTLYRQLAELCADGIVRKYRSDGQSAFVYQYLGTGDCGYHFHLKCVVCGAVTHLDCPLGEELMAHIRSDHRFRVDGGRSILYGCCDGCADTSDTPIQQPSDKPPCTHDHHTHEKGTHRHE